MHRTQTIIVLLVLSGFAAAQTSVNAVFRRLDAILPRKAPAIGAAPNSSPTGNADWSGAADQLGELLAEASGTQAEPFVLFAYGNALFSADRLDEARAIFEQLKTGFAKHPIVTHVQDVEQKKTVLDSALEDVAKEITFRSRHRVRSLEEPRLDSSMKVTLHLSIGDVELQFYENVAPNHRANFIELAKKGFYDRTACHRIVREQRVEFGDPNTRSGNPAEWGQGGPSHSLDHEFSRVSHLRGTVTMAWTPRRTQSHGSQFQIFLKDQPHVDFVQTPFAQVTKGMEILDRLSNQTRNQYDQPVEKCFINGISIAAPAQR